MLAGIHQSHYLPWLRYVEKIARCDIFIILDDIQFTKNGWQNRNRIKTHQGPALLTVPVHARVAANLNTIRIDDTQPWRAKHLRAFEQSYGKAPHFEAHLPFLRGVYGRRWERLIDLNRHMLDYVLSVMGIDTPIRYSSELDVEGAATERLVRLIKAVDATRYYSGAHAISEYLDAELMKESNIELVIQEWRSPVYPQLHGAYEPDLAVLDLLFNTGPDARHILMGGSA